MSGDRTWGRFDVVAQTRRRWSIVEKRLIVAEAVRSGRSLSAVARRHRIAPSLLFRWKQQLGSEAGAEPASPTFVPVVMAPTSAAPAIAQPSLQPSPRPDNGAEDRVEIELPNGRKLRFAALLDADRLRRLLAVLEAP